MAGETVAVTCSVSPCDVTVTHVVQLDAANAVAQWDAAFALSPEHVADYMELFGAFILAAVVVLGAKALYKRFRIDYEH